MALYKEIKLANGIIVSYHRIENIYYNFLENKVIVRLLSYKDKSYRDKEKLMSKSRLEADSIYQLLTNESNNLDLSSKQAYEFKLIKLVDILKDDIKDTYYIQSNEIEFRDILEFNNINYIYDKLKDLDLYSNAKEV